MAAALTGLLAELHHVPARGFRSDGHLGGGLFPIAEINCQYHLQEGGREQGREEEREEVRVKYKKATLRRIMRDPAWEMHGVEVGGGGEVVLASGEPKDEAQLLMLTS